MTTRCHIPLLKYCSTIVFTLADNTGLVGHLKPGMKLLRKANSLLALYPLYSYIFIQGFFFFFKAMKLVGGTAHFFFFSRRIRLSQVIQAQGSQVTYTACELGCSESYVFRFKQNKVL